MEAALDVLRCVPQGDQGDGHQVQPWLWRLWCDRPQGYVDADWASDKSTRRSASAYVFMIGGGCVSWRSKLQPTVALSAAEAEYVEAAAAAQEAVRMFLAAASSGGPGT